LAIGLTISLVFLIVIIIIVVMIVVRLRRKKNVIKQSVSYTSVSRDNSDLSSSVTYYNPYDRRGFNAEGPLYATPYGHNQYTTFRPPPSISARADNVRRLPAEYD
jgi:uncharacterized protein YxeA